MVGRHYPWLLAYMRAALPAEDAEDAAQDAIFQSLRDLPQLQELRAFKGWLRTIARRTCARYRNSGPVSVSLEQLEFETCEAAAWVDPASTPSAAVQRAWLLEEVRRAVAALDPLFREVVVLHYFEDVSVIEIARRLDIPIPTVGSRLRLARQRLRLRLFSLNNSTTKK